jgi:pyrroloquinoline quinone (PQQ) biosynthesis protein C
MTTADDIRTALDRGIGARRLLDHAFYRRWEAGSLGDGELARYAEQYRHFEAAVPRVLESCLATLADDTARAAVIRNLDDEAHGDRPHVDLFDDFARSVAVRPAAPATAATTALLDSLDGDGPAEVITALLTYEWQSPAVAASDWRSSRKAHQRSAVARARPSTVPGSASMAASASISQAAWASSTPAWTSQNVASHGP